MRRLLLCLILLIPLNLGAQTRWTTDSFVSATVTAGHSLVINRAISSPYINIVKIKVVPSTTGGATQFGIYKHATCLDADMVYLSSNFTYQLIEPVQKIGSTQYERNEGFIALYEDRDTSPGYMHVKITNSSTVDKYYTVTIEYEPVATQTPCIELTQDSSGYIYTDAALGDMFCVTLTKNAVLENPTNAYHGQPLGWMVKQDGTGGWTMTFGTKFKATTPIPSITLSTGANKRDWIGTIYDGDTDEYAYIAWVKDAP